MEWKAVESSQISEVGFDPKTDTLGIRFKPNKHQTENGERGSEYQYTRVGPALYKQLVAAESVGKFFGEHIKAHPETYPFTKVS